MKTKRWPCDTCDACWVCAWMYNALSHMTQCVQREKSISTIAH